MADNTILEAQVKLTVDQSSINKSIADASKKLESGLKRTDNKLSKQLSSQLNKDVGRLGKELEKSAKALGRVFEKGLKFGAGLGTASIVAFLKSGTPEAQKFSHQLDRLKISFAKVGQTLATKIKFGGLTGQQWLEKLVTKIENLDVSQIQKIVDYFKVAAGIWASIKIGEGIVQLGKIVGGAVDISKAIAKMVGLNAGANAIGTATAAATGVGAGAIGTKLLSKKITSADIRSKIAGDIVAGKPAGFRTGFDFAKAKQLDGLSIRDTFKFLGGRLKPTMPNLGAMTQLGMRGVNKFGDIAGNFISSTFNKIPGSGLIKSMTPFAKRALGPAAIAYDAFNTMRDERKLGRSWSESTATTAGSVASGIGGTMLGAKLGAALGTAIAPGIGTAIGGVVGSVVGYVAGSSGYKKLQDWVVGTSIIGTREEGIAAAERAKAARREGSGVGLYSSNQYKMDMSEPMRQLERKYIGKTIPLPERMKLMPSIPTNVKLMEDRVTALKSKVQPGEDITQYTTLYAEVQALEALIDAQKKFAAETEALADQINTSKEDIAENYKERMKDLEDNIKETKSDLTTNLEDFDYNANKRITQSAEQKDRILNPRVPKALATSITTGGDIGSIGAVISQGLNDANNERLQREQEFKLKQLDIADITKEEVIASREEAKERGRIIDEYNKRMEELEKERIKIEKDTLKAQQDLVKNTGGASTVTVSR